MALALVAALVPAVASASSRYSRDSAKDIDISNDVEWPRGVWGNSSTLWVVESSDNKLYAYSHVSGTRGDRQSSKDIDISATSESPRGVWSDGTTIWVANEFNTDWERNTPNVMAYNLSDGTHDSDKSFDLSTNNNDPRSIWSDGTTLWVLEPKGSSTASKLFAYTLSTGSRNSSKDINNLHEQMEYPGGLWSDGTTMWIGHSRYRISGTQRYVAAKVYAYNLSSGSRDTGKEFSLTGGNESSTGMWSDGTTMWVADKYDDKLYAYRMSGSTTGGL